MHSVSPVFFFNELNKSWYKNFRINTKGNVCVYFGACSPLIAQLERKGPSQ